MHAHKYKVMPSSTFGLRRVHAVLVCEGVIDKHPCNHKITKVLFYSECEKEVKGMAGKITYFWTPTEVIEALEAGG